MRSNGLLRLSPNRHSAKLLPHRHTSYGGLAALLALVGIVMVLLTLGVAFPGSADSGDITVSGLVPGAPPATAPTITSPANNTHVGNQRITVSGSCAPGLTVVVTGNQAGRGSVLCDQNGTFSLVIDLTSGTNILAAYHLDSLNQSGPTSNTVAVIYQPVSKTQQAVPVEPSLSTNSNTPGSQFTVTAPYRFDGVQSGQTFTLHGDIEGGTAPYALQINWGDGTQTLLSRAIKGAFTVQHIYATAGQFIIKLVASDVNGITTYFQTMAVVGGAAALKPLTPAVVTPIIPAYNLSIIWPVFLVACLAVFSFWLGEYYDQRRGQPTAPLPPTSL